MFHGIAGELFQKRFGSKVQLLIFATRNEKSGSREAEQEEEEVAKMLAKDQLNEHKKLKASTKSF